MCASTPLGLFYCMNESLENVKVGDKLFLTTKFRIGLVVVKKVFDKVVIAGDHKYWKDSGRIVSSDENTDSVVRRATKEDAERLYAFNHKKNMIRKIKRINLNKLSNSQLEEILEISNIEQL